MSAELPKAYDPAAVEPETNRVWTDERLFHAEPTDGGTPYSIVIPPPNVTAALHLGHALNNTLQDILTRVHRMMGDNTEWIPGTDHAGIATQTVVEKRVLAEEGKRRTEFKREEFVGKIQAWKDEYEKRITEQLRLMGCSCDYERQAFTMDEPRAKAVREAFFQLFKDGLIYRGKRLVNWDPVTQTALADDEVENEEVDGAFYYMRYPLVAEVADASLAQGTEPGRAAPNGAENERLGESNRAGTARLRPLEYITVATTRPETMLGDTAVAINPKDPRAAELRGRKVLLPLVNREIPIIEDEYVVLPISMGGDEKDVKAQFASGFLKVTPAHDPNDYDIGQRHKLEMINIFSPTAAISKDHGWPTEDFAKSDPFVTDSLVGVDRFEARTRLVKWFKDAGLLENVKPYRHSVGHSYRSHVPIEPWLSDQWYCKVTDDRLRGAALRAMAADQKESTASPSSLPLPPGEGRGEGDLQTESRSTSQPPSPQPSPGGRGGEETTGLRFFPARYAKTFQTWHENLRDWSISRQLWWGHRIPVWSIHFHGPRTEASAKSLRTYLQALWLNDQVHIADGGSDEDTHLLFICSRSERSDRALLALNAFYQMEGNAPKVSDFGDVLGDPAASNAAQHLMNGPAASQIHQDPDVLDTWFSSALWPMSTLGWPDPSALSTQHSALNVWNPTSVLCTAREIITLWVSRMVMFNLYFLNRLPFRHVFIHAMIQDGHGQKMSKTLGNGLDPLDVIQTHGADALRFAMASMATNTQDVRMPVDVIDPYSGESFTPKWTTTSAGYTVAAPIQESPKHPGKKFVTSSGVASGAVKASTEMPVAKNTSAKFDLGRNFCNKLWNAARFAMMNLSSLPLPPGEGRGEGASANQTTSAATRTLTPTLSQGEREQERKQVAVDESKWSIADRWIVSRFNRTVAEVNDAIAQYRFDNYAKACYDFFWRDFCDWYLECIKPAMRDPARAPQTANVLASVLDGALRLMHPLIPFITEKIWWNLNEIRPQRGIPGRLAAAGGSPRLVRAPWPTVGDFSEAAEFIFPKLQEVIGAIRNLRNDHKVEPRRVVTVSILAPGDAARSIQEAREIVETLATCTLKEVSADLKPSPTAARAQCAGCEIFVEGMVDEAAESGRIAKRCEELKKQIAAMKVRLGNESYTAKAPAHLVQQTKDQLAAAEAELLKLGCS